MNRYAYCGGNPISYVDPEGEFAESINNLSRGQKIALGIVGILLGTGVTVITGGAAAPAIAAGIKAAVIAGSISAATNVTITTVNSVISGDEFSWDNIGNAAIDGLADGIMSGGIMAGASQTASAIFKLASTAGIETGRQGGIYLTQNIKILSPDAVWQKNNGGTLIKIGNTFRIDVNSNQLLHMHLSGQISEKHIQIGTIISGIFSGRHK